MFGSVEDKKIPSRPAAVFIVSGSAVSCNEEREAMGSKKNMSKRRKTTM